jgi:hypothetical protein
MRPDIVPGGVFPDYELSDHRGMHRTLSELQDGGSLRKTQAQVFAEQD